MAHTRSTKTTPLRTTMNPSPQQQKTRGGGRRRRSRRGARKLQGPACSSPIVDHLPSEIIAEVVARVASSSFADFLHCKLSCKALLDVAKERQVLQRLSLDELPFFTWPPTRDADEFFKTCQESQNPEALFQLGMWQYFSCVMVEEAIMNLEKAATQGHMVATYVLGLLFLCTGDLERKDRGVMLLMNVMERFKGKGIVECRKKLEKVMRRMWINNDLILQTSKPSFSCVMEEEHGGVRHGWRKRDDYDEEWEDRVVCPTCRCRRELDFFFNSVM